MGDGVDVVDERIGGRQQSLGLDGVGGLDGEVERAARPSVGERLGAVGVGALEFGLAVPETGEVEVHVGRHPEQHDPSARAGDAQALGDAGAVADGVDRDVRTRTEVVADDVAPCGTAHGAREFRRCDDRVGAELLGEHTLVRVAGADDDPDVGHVAAESGDRRQAHRAGAEHRDDRSRRRVLAGGDRRCAQQRGVDAAGERFDEHRPLVGHVIGDRVELRRVGDERRRPAAAGRAAEPGLDARLERPGGEVGVVVAVAGRGALERRSEAAGLVAEDRFEDHPRAVVEFADHLVAGDERERHPVVEVQRGVALDERQVGSADAREAGVHPLPAGAGELGFVDGHVTERADLRGPGR